MQTKEVANANNIAKTEIIGSIIQPVIRRKKNRRKEIQIKEN